MHGVEEACKRGPRAHSWHRAQTGEQVEPSPRVLVPTMRRITVMSEDRKTVVFRRKQAARDQVRIAYGAVPTILEGLPVDDPFRAAIRNRARSLLMELGCLTLEELGTLPVKDAITTALGRCRAETGRTDQGRATQPRRGATALAHPAM